MDNESTTAAFYGGFCCGLSFVAFPIFVFMVTTPWLRCFLSGAGVTVWSIVGMRLRGSPVRRLVDTQIALVHSGYEVRIHQVESAYLANRHRIIQPGDLLGIMKSGLEAKKSRPVWADSFLRPNSEGQGMSR